MLIKHGHWKYNIAKPVLSYKMHIYIYPLLEPKKHIKKNERLFLYMYVGVLRLSLLISLTCLFELVN